MSVKIYKVSAYDWFAAESANDAMECAKGVLSYDDDEYYKDPVEVSESKMDTLIFVEDDDHNTYKAFRKKLDEMCSTGHKFPCFFASTEV